MFDEGLQAAVHDHRARPGTGHLQRPHRVCQAELPLPVRLQGEMHPQGGTERRPD